MAGAAETRRDERRRGRAERRGRLSAGDAAALGALAALVADPRRRRAAAIRISSSVENVFNVLRQNAVLGLVAVGMTMVIISGGIDLSVGSMLSFTSVVAVKLAGHGLVVAIGVPVLVGAVLGLANGLVVTRLRIAPFIATLATLMALRGLTIALFGEETVALAEGREAMVAFGRATVVGLPIQVPIVARGLRRRLTCCCATPRFGRAALRRRRQRGIGAAARPRRRADTTVVYAISGGLSPVSPACCSRRGSAPASPTTGSASNSTRSPPWRSAAPS